MISSIDTRKFRVEAYREKLTLREAALKLGFLTAEQRMGPAGGHDAHPPTGEDKRLASAGVVLCRAPNLFDKDEFSHDAKTRTRR
jgi:hypothetical protein